jgi:DNA-binding response OmpR family regulator
MIQPPESGPRRGLDAALAERKQARREQMRRLAHQAERLVQARDTLTERLVAFQRNVDELVRTTPTSPRLPARSSAMVNGALALAPRAVELEPAGDAVVALRPGTDEDGAAVPWQTDQRLTLGPVEVLPVRQTVICGAHSHRLTPTEWQLLAYMMAHPRKVLTRAELAAGAWGPGFSSRASEVEVYISRLRKQLEWDGARVIETVRGSGYWLTESPQPRLPDTLR